MPESRALMDARSREDDLAWALPAGRLPFPQLAPARRVWAGARILVTGAGGSIGARVALRLAQLGPQELVLVDVHAGRLEAVMAALRDCPSAVVPVLGSITDAALLDRIWREHDPQIIVHAGALKHVDRLESRPLDALRVNTLATGLLLERCEPETCQLFLLLSTDKAAAPRSILGASKRAAERELKARASRGLRALAVRLVNVLGSRDSVLPTWLAQARAGLALTVSHEEATRWFLTLDEAVNLILAAPDLGQAGDILIPDPGASVSILDLGLRVAAQAGCAQTPTIRFTGLRPGDKLAEQLTDEGEQVRPTSHSRVQRVCGRDARPTGQDVLAAALRARDVRASLEWICRVVPEYRPGPELVRLMAAQVAAS